MRQTICKTALVLLIVQALVTTAAAQANDKSRSDTNRSTVSTSAKKSQLNTRQVSSIDYSSWQRRRFWLYFSLSSVFDSNIDHDENNVHSFGLVPSLGIHFQSNVDRPAFEFDYETALHRYSNTSRWDRMSHKARASYERGFTDFLRSEITGEMSIKGSSEDRELSDQYALRQAFKIRASRTRRFNIFGAYRIKRDADDPGRNAIDPYIGASFEQRFAGRRSFELSYRYD